MSQLFRCGDCGASPPRWEGRCTRCGAWGTVGPEAGTAPQREAAEPRRLDEIATTPAPRRSSGFGELDRVLGGGLVPGSCVLVGGEPGIGKSTLLLAACARAEGSALYVAGEEAADQVALRARRLGLDAADLLVMESTDTGEVTQVLGRLRPALCVVDSIQTLHTSGCDGAPGGPAQVRAAAEALVPAARATGVALLLVGQVTKEGGLAGPRTLEHAVDTVLFFEGDRHISLRALRAIKNRYGPTDEIGLFEMREDGLHEVRDASRLLLGDRAAAGPGSVVACVVEGRRPLCVEVQALLVGEKRLSPRRRAQGADPRRAELLVGVIESLFCRGVGERDVFVNLVGGLSVQDTGLDLALAAAVLGAETGRDVDRAAVVIGEVGLRGEVRSVPQIIARLKEARAMGFELALVPAGSPTLEGIRNREVRRVSDVFSEAEWEPGQ